MRPISKGAWPVRREGDPTQNPPRAPLLYSFNDWSNAKSFLEDMTGKYCHFCERRINNSLAVEHIKARKTHGRLSASWTNFLLICTSCNSRKSAGRLLSPYRQQYYWPHLNNTFMVFEFVVSGNSALVIRPKIGLSPAQSARAQRTIDLYALDQPVTRTGDADERAVYRYETLSMALELLGSYSGSQIETKAILYIAISRGDFSMFLEVFKGYPAVCNAIVNSPDFPDASRFFDPNLIPIPRNPHNLADPI